MKLVHAALVALSLVACSSDEPIGPTPPPPPGTSPTLNLLLFRSSVGVASLSVYFDGPATPGCDASDFVQPGETRTDDDVVNPCPIATCVSELRLVRGDQIVEAVQVDPQAPSGYFPELVDESGLELEIRGCGAPRRLPLWTTSLVSGAEVALLPGDPPRISTDMPGERVSLLSSTSDGWTYVREHSAPGASSVGVVVQHRATYVGITAIEQGEASDLDGLQVRRWSGISVLDTQLCVPARNTEGRWDVVAATIGPAQVTLGAPDGTTIALRPLGATLDRPDAEGFLRFRADPMAAAPWSAFTLEQGSATDTLRLERDGKIYEATTPHVTPATPLHFGLEGDTAFRVDFPALHFVATTDATDVVDLDGLGFRWQVSHLVPVSQP